MKMLIALLACFSFVISPAFSAAQDDRETPEELRKDRSPQRTQDGKAQGTRDNDEVKQNRE